MEAKRTALSNFDVVAKMVKNISKLNNENKAWFLGFAEGLSYGVEQNTTTDRAE